MSPCLGIAAAVREYGDNWLIAPHLTRFVAETVLLEYRVSVRERGPDHRDACIMEGCTRWGRYDQTNTPRCAPFDAP